MSHRITTQTSINDKEVAIAALKSKGWSYDFSGNTLHITSGPMSSARIDLATGVVEADSDHVRREALTSLNQAYGVALCEKQAVDQGGYVESTETLDNGDIRLIVNVSFG
jgi:hypothetical protein